MKSANLVSRAHLFQSTLVPPKVCQKYAYHLKPSIQKRVELLQQLHWNISKWNTSSSMMLYTP